MGLNGTIPRVHLYQGAANTGPKVRTQAQDAAEGAAYHLFSANDWVFRLNCIPDFFGFLLTLRGAMLTCQRADLYAHAEPGRFAMGGDPFGYNELDMFEGQGWEVVFEPKSEVYFNCCDLASSADGEYFLARFASIFLGRGGTAYAANTKVIDQPWFGVSFTLSACGSGWVRAEVSAGGKLKLHNSAHLNSQRLISRLEALQTKLNRMNLIPSKPQAVKKIDLGNDLSSAGDEIPKRIAALKADYGPAPSSYDFDQNPPASGKADWYKDLWWESRYVARLERQL